MSNSEYVPELLNSDELKKMVSAHQKYITSEGREGCDIDLAGYIIKDFDFSGLDLNGVSARISVFIRCKFNDCDLYRAYFNGSELVDVDFSDAVLVKTELHRVKAKNTHFDRAKLGRAEFIRCTLTDVSFRNADLHSAIICDSELVRTCFDGANVEGAAIDDNKEEETSWGNLKE
jgi:uncharacterized protein YjbI with pentapeptide repeats